MKIRPFKQGLTFVFLLLITFIAGAQNHQVELNWGMPKVTYQNGSQLEKALWFENASYNNIPSIPLYVIEIGVLSDEFELEIQFDNQIWTSLTEEEELIFSQSGFVANTELQYSVNRNIIKKENHTQIYVTPFRKSESTGKLEKLVSCNISVSPVFSANTDIIHKIGFDKTTESVLNSGTFYKFSVVQPGIYKITYTALMGMGIDVEEINPKDIRIYGNGGQMLPEANSSPRYDDLFENAIFVSGESDSVFDPDDYILFYATGPHSWSYDTINGIYQSSINRFSDKSYYFITVEKGTGKRIETVNNLSETPIATTSQSLDRLHTENETYNLIKSGKEWYGDVFDVSLSQSFSFSFPNFNPDSCVKINVAMVARAPGTTTASVSSGSSVLPLSFSGTTSYTSDYAKPASGNLCVQASSSITVNITYNKQSYSDAKAWLNFLTANAWRNLTMTGNQMHFRNPEMVYPGQFVQYDLTGSSSMVVWDITNPLEPSIVAGDFVGSTLSIIADASVRREFVSYTGLSFLSPVFEGTVANQNLHGLPQTDYIIVSYPSFSEEARKIGEFHQQLDGLSFVVVSPQQIFNEFSSGSQDPTAIRDFVKMFYDRAATSDELPKYLLLFGRASYDYKNRISDNTNFVPTFQSFESLNPTKSYASDDYFGLLDDTEGYECNGNLDIAIGRLPAKTQQEADEMISKIFRYHQKTSSSDFQNSCDFISFVPNLGDWRNVVTFISDDGNMNLHFNQSEGISTTVKTAYPYLNIDKIHLDAYPQYSTPGGERAPDVNESINRRMFQGCLIMNYTGHGGEVGWAHERILELSDIGSWKNYYSMPLFITATCEFSRFDDPGRIAAGEQVLTNPTGGGIALFSTTRLAFSNYNENLNRSVYEVAFEKTAGVYPTLGEILAYAKTDNGSTEYIRNFILLGDPAMRLAYPQHQVFTSTINGNPIGGDADTISALSFVTVTGYVADGTGTKLTDFNGTITPTVYDKTMKINTLVTDPSDNYAASFYLQKNTLYKGKVSVVNGDFSFSFYVPKDINYSFGTGKISYYAENGVTDATGYFSDFYVGGSDENATPDDIGPYIRLFMNDISFSDGGTTNENPVLIALLEDSTGINTLGTGIGHDIITILDASGNVIVLNDNYESDLDSYKSGRVVYPFYDLEEGVHTVYFKAWDVYNNSSEAALTFLVAESHEAVIKKLLNYPNPFTDYTDFVFEHNQSCTPLSVTIDIFNINGQHVCRVESEHESLGYRIEPIRWYGVSHDGNPLASGVYLYTVTLITCEGAEAVKSSRLVIVK